MYPDWFVVVGLAAVSGWLLVLNILVWQQHNFLRSLFPASGARDIRKKFKETIEQVEGFGRQLDELETGVETVRTDGLKSLQRVGFLRFNPFHETGGNLSFTLCLLDDRGSGIVLTSLHARSGTRVFSKEIVLGKSSKYELSKEEELVIKKAMAGK